MGIDVKIKYHEDYNLNDWGPLRYAKAGDAGVDLRSVEKGVVYPKNSAIFRCGISIELPDNYEMQVRSRGGLAFKNDIQVHFGTVDSGYRGEIMLKVFNLHNKEWLVVEPGMRLAQAIFCYVPQIQFSTVDELNESERGDDAFASSGLYDFQEQRKKDSECDCEPKCSDCNCKIIIE